MSLLLFLYAFVLLQSPLSSSSAIIYRPHQEESDAKLLAMEEKHESETRRMQTDIAAWTEVSL